MHFSFVFSLLQNIFSHIYFNTWKTHVNSFRNNFVFNKWNVFETLDGEKKSIMKEDMQIYPANIFTTNTNLCSVTI